MDKVSEKMDAVVSRYADNDFKLDKNRDLVNLTTPSDTVENVSSEVK